ncbi:MAG: TRAP transporter permease, partial [Deltaproteobacteria bacterium]|nr:TRAP transporter permease [Candidatus Tharpellaceae bacterium]
MAAKEDNHLEQKIQLEEIIAEETGEFRILKGLERYFIPVIAVTWSLFQLSISSWLLLDSITIRAIHLAFAMLIIFLSIPVFKKPRKHLRFLAARDRIPWNDYLFAIIGAISALYLYFNWEGISGRAGMPSTLDLVFGIILL